MTMRRSRALALLAQCSGNEIWSLPTCRAAGVPEQWIAELADAFESGFATDRQTIYVGQTMTNQYHGVRDVDLAIRAGKLLGVDVDQVTAFALDGRAVVVAIQRAVEEGD